VSALETEEQLLLAGITDDGRPFDESACRRLFDLPGTMGGSYDVPPAARDRLDGTLLALRQTLLDQMTSRNGRWFDAEMDKLDRWAEDRRASLKAELAEVDEALKEAKKAARFAPTLPDKLERQREVRKLESRRDEAWRTYDQASRELDQQKDALLDDLSRRLQQAIDQEPLFTLRWSLT
jgi:hypothetical protein